MQHNLNISLQRHVVQRFSLYLKTIALFYAPALSPPPTSRASESLSWSTAVFEHIMVERGAANAVRRGNAEHVSERCYETHSLNGILTNSCLRVGKYLFSMEI